MILKKRKIPKYIIDDIEFPSDSDRENPDEENSGEQNSVEKNLKNSNKTDILKLIFKTCQRYFL